ncbi:leukocyte receptor cluster member 1 [Strongylocentrotus purpuratus]|uniref:CBF1-interacting co-repressor CIR N-terminal domain-containing protein n=1 Tax=Strongylocentrotus purpuratus TaxID=7668 RepID=A0A7M7N5I4_STRPU|nr:leukocyte receptor cluster member 1 [Strongylocentrotus purpuratus]
MNILPKKSWHVRTRDNIAKVKRDEAQAAEEEKEKEGRIALAEQEARTEKLRIKARNKSFGNAIYGYEEEEIGPQPMPDVAPTGVSPSQPLPRTHINFFSEIEAGSNTNTGNKDHEAEKKQEQDAYEKKIGLLVGLGQSAIETQPVKPWYQQNREEKDKKSVDATSTDTHEMKRKASMDPMNAMLRYLGKKPKSVTETKTTIQQNSSKEKESLPKGVSNHFFSHTQGLPGTTSLMKMFSKYKNKSKEEENGKETTSHKKHKEKKRKKNHRLKESRRDSKKHSHKKSSSKHRKHSRHHSDSTSSESEDTRREARLSRRRKKSQQRDRKHKRKSSRSDSNSDSQSSSSNGSEETNNQKLQVSAKPTPTIEQLRAERVRREAAERTKTERFLAGKPLVEQPAPVLVITDKLDGKYNSQFNPHLARKRQPKEPLF